MAGLWVALLVAACTFDVKSRRLPNGLLAAAALLGLLMQGARFSASGELLSVASAPFSVGLWHPVPPFITCLASASLFLGAAVALELVCRRHQKSLMGLGDIKLLAVLTLSAGPFLGLVGGLMGCSLGGLVALVRKETHFAAGPWILAGCLVLWAWCWRGVFL